MSSAGMAHARPSPARFAFERLIEPRPLEGDESRMVVRFQPGQAFMVGGSGTVMGGCVLAVVLQAAHRLVQGLHPHCRHVVNVSSTFIEAVTTDMDYIVELEVLRAGGRTVHTVTRLTHKGQTAHIMVGVFGEIPFPEAGEEDDDFYRFIELEEQFVPAEKRGPREGEFGAGDWRLQEGGEDAEGRPGENGMWVAPSRRELPDPGHCVAVGPDGWMHGGVSKSGSYAGRS